LLLALGLGPLGCGDGCSGCPGAAPPVDHQAVLLARVPADALAVALVPRTDHLAAQLQELYLRLQPRFPDLAKLADDLRRRLGFDLRDAATLEPLGLEPTGALLVAAHRDWLLLGMSVDDRDRFEDFLRRRFETEQPGQLELRRVPLGERQATLVVPRTGEPSAPLLGFVEDQSQLFVVAGRSPRDLPVDPLQVLGGLLASPPTAGLAAQPQFSRLRAAAGGSPGLLVWLNTVPLAQEASSIAQAQGQPDGARLLQGLGVALQGLAIGLDVAGTGLTLRGQGLVEPQQHRLMQDHLRPTRPAPELTRRIPEPVTLLARGSFNPGLTAGLVGRYLPAGLHAQLGGLAGSLEQDLGVSPEQLSGLLTGNFALAFYGIDLAAGLPDLLQRKLTFSLSAVDAALYLQLGDPATARKLLGLAAGLLVTQGARVTTVGAAPEVEITTVTYADRVQGSWLLHDDLLVLTSGGTRAPLVHAALTGAAAGPAAAAPPAPAPAPAPAPVPAPAPAGAAIPSPGPAGPPPTLGGLVLSVPALLRNMPFIGLLLPQVGATLTTLDQLTLDLTVTPDGVGGEVRLTFTAPPPAAKK